MDCKAQKLLIGLLLAALAGSWAWFYSTQQQTNAQLALLLSKAGSGSGRGRVGVDPYRDEAVKTALRQHTAEIQKLWLAYLDRAPQKTEGVIEAEWWIGADGKVEEAGIAQSDFTDAALNDGLLAVLKSIQYPPPPLGLRTTMTHTFKLKKTPDAAPSKP